MADIKKFLDQSGVSTLWSRVAEELAKVDNKVAGHETRIEAAESKIEALEKGTYDDTEVRGLIADNATAIGENKAAHEANAAAIATLNGTAETVGSVANTATSIAAAKVAEIVAGADAKYDTLKEIADWILNDTTGAADMANDIAALQGQLAGVEATVIAEIASSIETALKVDGVDKYALASDLSSLADRVKAVEDAGYQNADQVSQIVDSKINLIGLDNYATKQYADGVGTTTLNLANEYANGLAANYDAAGTGEAKAAAALAEAKSYTDTEIAKIQALTPAEIDAAIAAAKAQAQA